MHIGVIARFFLGYSGDAPSSHLQLQHLCREEVGLKPRGGSASGLPRGKMDDLNENEPSVGIRAKPPRQGLESDADGNCAGKERCECVPGF